ncbi:YegP family protein [Anoxybacillus kestanbolensis]|uniref:YegP family protein n=1 Tax=Anoxybacillus kestanbolensis TaxID=227476 RepID=UPI003D1F51A3
MIFYSRSAKFKIRSSRDGQYYFVLIAPNNEVVATSETYSTKQKCKEGIEAVKKYAMGADVEDETV